MRRKILIAVTSAMIGTAESGTAKGAAELAPARGVERLFWSGHSLTDRPLPDQFAAIAASLGRPVQWNAQMIQGSSIKMRSQGHGNWSGYKNGENREGRGLAVAAELRAPRTVAGGPYDALIITEQHTLLGNLVWNDTIGHLRHFHDRAIKGNPGQTTYLYQSWLGIDDRNDPRRWIAYEKAAAPAWRCVAMRINASLASVKRPDRIVPIDAGTALATFVEQAVAGKVAGFTGPPRSVIDRLFKDDVHLTPLGTYFVALFVFAELSGTPPKGAWAPADLRPAEAEAAQAAAWAIHLARAAAPHQSLDACRSYVGGPFLRQYLAYLRDKQAREDGRTRAFNTWLKHRIAFARVFGRQDKGNPLVFDAAADSDYSLAGD